MCAVRRCRSPGVFLPGEAAACRVFPLRLGRQPLAGPGRVGGGILPGHVHDRVVCPALDGASRSLRVPPVGARHPSPPLRQVVEVHSVTRGRKDQGARNQQVLRRRRRPGRELRHQRSEVRHAPGHRRVAGGVHEGAEFGVRDGVDIHEEAVHIDRVCRAFGGEGVLTLTPHHEPPAGDPHHAGRRVARGVTRVTRPRAGRATGEADERERGQQTRSHLFPSKSARYPDSRCSRSSSACISGSRRRPSSVPMRLSISNGSDCRSYSSSMPSSSR